MSEEAEQAVERESLFSQLKMRPLLTRPRALPMFAMYQGRTGGATWHFDKSFFLYGPRPASSYDEQELGNFLGPLSCHFGSLARE